MIRAVLVAAALSLTADASFAQHAGHSGTMAAAPAETAPTELPEICSAAHAGHMASSMGMQMPDMMPSPAHKAMMDSMMAMHEEMMLGMMAEDFDVAFVCGMIPHHQGAIAMAEAVLENGDDEWTKSLAREIIAAQEKEIADMLAWLESQPAGTK